jgi:hypothetical protein
MEATISLIKEQSSRREVELRAEYDEVMLQTGKDQAVRIAEILVERDAKYKQVQEKQLKYFDEQLKALSAERAKQDEQRAQEIAEMRQMMPASDVDAAREKIEAQFNERSAIQARQNLPAADCH